MNYEEEFRIALKFLKELKEKYYTATQYTELDLFLKKHEKRRWAVFETTDLCSGTIEGHPYCLVECYAESGHIATPGAIVGKFVKWVD